MLPCLPQDTVTQAAAGLGFRHSCPSVAMSATRHRQQQALASSKAAASVLPCLPQDTVTQAAAAGLGYNQSCPSVAMSATRRSDTGSGRFRLGAKPLPQYHHACLTAASISSCLPHGCLSIILPASRLPQYQHACLMARGVGRRRVICFLDNVTVSAIKTQRHRQVSA